MKAGKAEWERLTGVKFEEADKPVKKYPIGQTLPEVMEQIVKCNRDHMLICEHLRSFMAYRDMAMCTIGAANKHIGKLVEHAAAVTQAKKIPGERFTAMVGDTASGSDDRPHPPDVLLGGEQDAQIQAMIAKHQEDWSKNMAGLN